MKKLLVYSILAVAVVFLSSLYYVNNRDNGKDTVDVIESTKDITSEQNRIKSYEKFSNFSYVLNKDFVENGDKINLFWKGCEGVNDIVLTAQSAFDGVDSKIFNIENAINGNGNFSWIIPSDFPSGVFRVFISSNVCASKSETDLRIEIQKPLEKTLENENAFIFLEQIREEYSVSGPIIRGEVMWGVSGNKINVDDLVGIEIEKYLKQNLQHSDKFTSQSNDGLYYTDQIFCMNFGRTTSNNGPFLWCTNNKDVIK